MKRNVTVAVGALCLAAAGWAVANGQDRPPQRQETQQRPAIPPPSRPQMDQPATGGGTQATTEVCPVGIQGLQARVMTIPEGGALQLTVAEDQVSELRSRMERFVEIHAQSHHSGAAGSMGPTGGRTGAMGGGSASAGGSGTTGGASAGPTTGGAMQAPARFADQNALIHQAQEVRIVEIPRGVRLEVRQIPSAQLDALRSELRQTAQQLTQGRCPLALQIEAA